MDKAVISALPRRHRDARPSTSSTTRDESWEIFAATAPELQDELNEQAWFDTIPRFALSPAALDIGRYARFERFLHDAGLVEEVRPVKDFAVDVNAE